ncbi:helix-turn-helix domain-containing protein [Ruficoccus sp. ZRK36]|uniref:IclR family transcriptional regulator n=1 Tax=Ruficoccus sp. ZRK36 TaxID=2866311 RepID=UPI001C738D05|nr:helix-turn-helix domain-containing protein [Ruficoccus sp. ZRK36]QYY35084.1 helix-turn-helix domain-containing protein [Ruficoccus sp. ZRK36]
MQSLQRGLALFEAIAKRREGMTLKELAAVIGCSAPATFHLVGTLVEAGYVQRLDSPARYIVGSKWRQLTESKQQDHFYQVVYEAMRELSKALPHTSVHFSEYIGDSVIVRADAPEDAPGLVREGLNHILPPYASAGSFAHLAFWPEEIRSTYQSRYQFEVYGLNFWGSYDAYASAIQSLRDEGVYFMPNIPDGQLKLALPVFRPGGGIAAALTLHAKASDTQACAHLQQTLKDEALRMGRMITDNLSQ